MNLALVQITDRVAQPSYLTIQNLKKCSTIFSKPLQRVHLLVYFEDTCIKYKARVAPGCSPTQCLN